MQYDLPERCITSISLYANVPSLMDDHDPNVFFQKLDPRSRLDQHSACLTYG